MKLTTEVLAWCRLVSLDPAAFCAHRERMMLSGLVSASDGELAAIGINISSPEFSEAEVALLAKADAEPAFIASRKRRAQGGAGGIL